MSNIDISIVIPAYNAGDFIEETIHSVLSQSSKDFSFEVLLIDDGSTDNTFKIAKAISKKNKQLLVFTQENSGSPSKPRNKGIDLARGKYILFLDADDFLCPNALVSMYKEAITSKNQIILGKFIGRNGRRVPDHIFMKTIHKADLLEDMAWHNLSPTAKLCAIEPIKNNGLRFFEDQWIGEDQNFFANLYFKAEGISILSDQIYVEVGLRDNGTNLTTRQQTLNDKAKTSIRLGNVIKENTVKGVVRDRLSQRIFTSTLPSVINQLYRKESSAYQRQKFVYNMHTYLSDLYSPIHRTALSKKVEIAYSLMFAGLIDDLDLLLCGKDIFDPTYVLENNKLCAELPKGLSKEALNLIYKIPLPQNLVKSSLVSILKTKSKKLHIVFNIELLKIKAKPDKLDIVLRERKTGKEIVINNESYYEFNSKTNSWNVKVNIILDKSLEISKGAWGTFYRIFWGDESVIEDRWGKRVPEIENRKFGIKLNNEDLIAYFNHGYENLTFDIGYVVHNKENSNNLFS